MAVQIIDPENHNQSAQAANSTPKTSTGGGGTSPDERVAEYTEGLAWATVLLAFTTLGVLIVTWRAGVRQSRDMQASIAIAERSLTELEAPFVALKITESGIIRKYNEMGHDFQTIRFCATNHGRTPAQLIELTDLLALLPKNEGLPPALDPDTASRNTMPYGVIAPPNGESQSFSNNLLAFIMGKLVTDPLPLKENRFFFYGFVRYGTIFNEIFRVGFCYHFDLFSEKWLLTGGDKHNYCKKERKVTLPNGLEVYRG
jgi:hypothetical protein